MCHGVCSFLAVLWIYRRLAVEDGVDEDRGVVLSSSARLDFTRDNRYLLPHLCNVALCVFKILISDGLMAAAEFSMIGSDHVRNVGFEGRRESSM